MTSVQIRAILTLGQVPPVPLALPASPRPSPPVSMCGAGGGLCFAWRGQPPASACPPHGCPESPRLGVGGGFRVPRMRTVCAASGGCPRLIGWAKIAGHSVPMSTKFPGGCARRRFWLTVRFLSTRPRNCLLRTQQNQACCCVRYVQWYAAFQAGLCSPNGSVTSFGLSSHSLTDTKTDRENGKIGNLSIFFFTFFNFAIE